MWTTFDPNTNETPVSDAGGYTPVSMAFSPGANFLYTIVESPVTSERYICVYPTYLIELGSGASIANTLMAYTKMFDSPFLGKLTRVECINNGTVIFYRIKRNVKS